MTVDFCAENTEECLIFLTTVSAAAKMRFDGRQQLAQFRARSNQFSEAVQLLTARFTVDVAILMFFKYRFDQFLELLVHCPDPSCSTLSYRCEMTSQSYRRNFHTIGSILPDFNAERNSSFDLNDN